MVNQAKTMSCMATHAEVGNPNTEQPTVQTLTHKVMSFILSSETLKSMHGMYDTETLVDNRLMLDIS